MCSPTFKTWFFPCYLISCYKTNNDSWKLKNSPQLFIDLWDELQQSIFQKTYTAIFSRVWKLVWSNFQNYHPLVIPISCNNGLTVLWLHAWKYITTVICLWKLRQFAIQPCYFYRPYQWRIRMKKVSKSGFYRTWFPLLLDVNTHMTLKQSSDPLLRLGRYILFYLNYIHEIYRHDTCIFTSLDKKVCSILIIFLWLTAPKIKHLLGNTRTKDRDIYLINSNRVWAETQ